MRLTTSTEYDRTIDQLGRVTLAMSDALAHPTRYNLTEGQWGALVAYAERLSDKAARLRPKDSTSTVSVTL